VNEMTVLVNSKNSDFVKVTDDELKALIKIALNTFDQENIDTAAYRYFKQHEEDKYFMKIDCFKENGLGKFYENNENSIYEG
jgi:hypothetical protein